MARRSITIDDHAYICVLEDFFSLSVNTHEKSVGLPLKSAYNILANTGQCNCRLCLFFAYRRFAVAAIIAVAHDIVYSPVYTCD